MSVMDGQSRCDWWKGEVGVISTQSRALQGLEGTACWVWRQPDPEREHPMFRLESPMFNDDCTKFVDLERRAPVPAMDAPVDAESNVLPIGDNPTPETNAA